MWLCFLRWVRNMGLLHSCFPSTSTQKGLWKVCLAGCTGCSSSQAEKRIRPRICGVTFLCPVKEQPWKLSPLPSKQISHEEWCITLLSLLTSPKTHYEGSGHPRTSVSLHPLPSRVAAHTKHALKAHDVFQSWLSPKPSAKNKLVKSCFSQKDEILSCVPLQDNCS